MDSVGDIAVGMKRGSDELSMYNNPNSDMSTRRDGTSNGSDSKKLRVEEALPSRVIHIRRLPTEAMDAEVIALGLPFGKVTNILTLKGKNQKMTMRSYNILISAAWLNAVFWSSMPIVGWAGYAPDPTGATCTINWRQNDASFISYTMAVIAVNFVVPLTVMFYCYYNVSATVKRYKASNCLDSINVDWSDQMDVTKMSIVMIVMFLVAWSPYSMVCLWASFGDPKTIPAPMAIIAPLFAKSSTFYNPCIYVIANKKFRRAIIGMIRCQTRQRITISTQVPMTISQQPLTQ